MIYGFHRDDSGTSYTTVVIDGSVYKYGDNGFPHVEEKPCPKEVSVSPEKREAIV